MVGYYYFLHKNEARTHNNTMTIQPPVLFRPSPMLHRVVVTGWGAVSPLGKTFAEAWPRLLQGASGATTVETALQEQSVSEADQEIASKLPSQVAMPVRGLSARDSKTSRTTQLALLAAEEALQHSGLDHYLKQIQEQEQQQQTDPSPSSSQSTQTTFANDHPLHYMGVSLGCGMSSLQQITHTYDTLHHGGGYRRVSPHFVPTSLTNAAAGRISQVYGLQGPNLTTSTACAAASHALGDAVRWIQTGQAHVMVAGGAEAGLDVTGLAGFNRLRALSTRFNDDPTQASRPFDTHRDGFVMAEGAGIVILESLQHALARKATPLAEIIGYGAAADAHHATAPHPDGDGAERALRMALRQAQDSMTLLDEEEESSTSTTAKQQQQQQQQQSPLNIDYMNAHATSTPLGDEIEARVMDRILQTQEEPCWVSSTKGATGHLLGAAGALEAAITLQALQEQVIPPTLNLESMDYEPRNFRHATTANGQQKATINVAVSNSFGFGGTNACLVFARYRP